MSEMIDRLTVAICNAELGTDFTSADEMHPTARHNYADMVRAVLAEMRAPTDAMVAEGEREFFEHMAESRDWSLQQTQEAYQAMIDAALK